MKKIITLFSMILLSINLLATNYYWVGGSGVWSDYNNHWATSSGGATFQNQVPQSTDNVYFDANSFTASGQTVTVDQTIIQCADMVWTGVSNIPTLYGDYSNTLRIYGSLTLATGMTNNFNGQISMEATISGQTVTTAGNVINTALTFNGIGGEWILQDALTLNGTYSSVDLNNGTLNTNNQTVTASSFYSYNAPARTLIMGSSTFNLSGSNAWYIANTSAMTMNTGTSVINCVTNDISSFYGGGFSYHDVIFSAGAEIADNNIFHSVTIAKNGTINGSNTFDDLTFSPGYTYILPAGLTQTINNSLTVNGNCGALIGIVKSSTLNVQASIAKASGTITVSYVTLKDINATGGAIFTANNSLDLGNNTGWTINTLPSKNLYWVGNSGNWGDGNHWANISGGAPSGCSPTPVDNVFFDSNSFSLAGQTVTVNVPAAYCNDMTWTGAGNAPALYGDYSSILKIYGSLTLATGMNFNYIGPVSFEATTLGQTITTAGNVINTALTFNGIGGEWILQDALTLSGTYSLVNLNNGTLNTNNQTVTVSSFYSYNAPARTLIMGSSTFNLSGSNAWYIANTSAMTMNTGTSVINCVTNDISSFYGGGFSYHDVIFSAGAEIADNNTFHSVTIAKNGTINGSNTFDDLTFSPGFTYILPAGLTQTINNSLTVNGNCGALIGIVKSSTLNVQASIAKASGTITVSYVTLKDINATGGAIFTANNSLDLGNNTGWTINTLPSKNLYWVGNSGNWGDGNHWSTISGGAPSGCSPTPVDNVFFDSNSFSLAGQTVTVNVPVAYCNDMTSTGANNAPALYGDYSSILKIYGSLTLATGMNFNYIGPVSFEATTLGQTITTAGNVINTALTFNGIGGEWILQDALTLSGTYSLVNLNNGTLNTNNQTVTASSFYSYNAPARTLFMGSSTFNLSGSNAWYIANTSAMTMNTGTSVINCVPNDISSFYGGGFSYHDVIFSAGAEISDNNTFHNVTLAKDGNINNSNTFNNLTFSPGYTYSLPAGQTQTVNNICAQGTGALPIRIQSNSTGTPAIISKPSGTICWDYVRVSDINATGGATFNAGLAPTNSQDMGGNTGLLFTGGCTFTNCLSTPLPLSCTSPIITNQPTSMSACAGIVVPISILANGANLTYQWQVNQGAGFTNLSNIPPYMGVTQSMLSIAGATLGMNGFQYRCVVKSDTCSSTSNAATLTVKPLPNVTVNSPTICSGQTATLTATGANSYFWPNPIPFPPPFPPLPPSGDSSNPKTVSPIITTSYTVIGTTNGCTGTAIATVTVYPMPTISAGNDTTVVSNTSVQLGSAFIPAFTYSWSPTTGLSNATVSNPTLVLQNNGNTPQTFSYILNATNGTCSKTDTVLITITPSQTIINLGTAKTFGLLSGGSISSTDNVFVYGNAGALTTVSNNVIATAVYANGSSVVNNALTDLISAKTYCTAQIGTSISGLLSGQTLSSGVYKITGNANMNGTLVLTGDSNSVFIFNISDSLIVSTNSVVLLNNVRPENVLWNVARSFNINGLVSFSGIIMAGEKSLCHIPNWGKAALMSLNDINISTTNGLVDGNSLYSSDYLAQIIMQPETECSATGCNLICNPSFEETNPGVCTMYGAGVYNGYSVSWSGGIQSSSPELYNSCNINNFALISNYQGSQTADCTPANGYAGIRVYLHWPPNTIYSMQEYLSGKLTTTLTANTCYYFEMHVSLAEASNMAISNMGAYFSATNTLTANNGTNDVLLYNPQIENPVGNFLSNKTGWETISGTFTALGNEQYVYIGNFFEDVNTPTIQVLPLGDEAPYSYYYVDNLLLTPFSVDAGSNVNISCGTSTTLNAAPSSCQSCYGAYTGITYSWAPATGIISDGHTSHPVVSPVTNTTYTVTATTAGGCSVTDMVEVTVTPLVITVSSPTICSGTVTTLFANSPASNVTYTWSNNVNNYNLNTATVLPFITTTYTVTGTADNGCSNTTVSTVTVKPKPVATATPSSQAICSGNATSIALTSSISGTTFNWTVTQSGATGATAGNGTSIAQTLTTTGTTAGTAVYTITPMAAGCVGLPISVTITIKRVPNVHSSPAAQTICSGNATSIALTSGIFGTTFGWTVSQIGVSGATPGTGSTISQTLTATGTTEGTATYIITPTYNGCPGTPITTIITVSPPSCCLPNSHAITGNISNYTGSSTGQNFTVTGTLIINQNYTFDACNIIMAPNAKIQVNTLKTLTITNKTHIYACTSMWDGISVQTFANLKINKDSFIEDGIKAISLENRGNAKIDETILNRNLIAIELKANISNPSPLELTASVITSRNIPFSANVLLNPTAAAVWADVIMTIPTYTTANLKTPYTNVKGNYGVNATNVRKLKIGSAGAGYNGFDEILCGINIKSTGNTNTSTTIYNNNFQNLKGYAIFQYPGPPPPFVSERGIGIKATAPAASSGTNEITIGNTQANNQNSFYNTHSAVLISGYKNVDIINNTINNSITVPYQFNVPTNYGNAGISVLNPAASNIINIKNNSISNCLSAVWINRALATSVITSSITVKSNTITADATGTAYCVNGINIQDITNNNPLVFADKIKIQDNTVTNVQNCISASNVKKGLKIFENPEIGIAYDATAQRHGIRLTSCENAKVFDNCHIYSTLSGTSTQSAANVRGIYVYKTKGMQIQCNQIYDVTQGLLFEGSCVSSNLTTIVKGNKLYSAYYGLYMKNSAAIGTQGSPTVASENYWYGGTGAYTWQTFVDNVANVNNTSKFYVRSGGGTITVPTNHGESTLLTKYINGTGIIPISAAVFSGCSCIASIPPINGSASLALQSTTLTTLILDTAGTDIFAENVKWQNKKYAYQKIDENTSLASNNAVLNPFYTSTANFNIGKLSEVEKRISIADNSAANTINANITPDGIMEENQKRVNELILQNEMDTSNIYSSADSSDVYNIAQQCYITGGDAVIQARALYCSMITNLVEFEDVCINNTTRSAIINNVAEANTKNISLYPNPNDGNMILKYRLSENETGMLNIYDLSGKLLHTYNFSSNTTSTVINANELNAGVYMYDVLINNTKIKTDKLIIIK